MGRRKSRAWHSVSTWAGTGTGGSRAGWIGGLARACSQGLVLAMAGGSHWILSEELGQGLGRAGLSSQTESE